MIKSALINAKEVAEILGTSKSHAYKMVQKLNEELSKQGYMVIAGKVSRAYFEEKNLWTTGGSNKCQHTKMNAITLGTLPFTTPIGRASALRK